MDPAADMRAIVEANFDLKRRQYGPDLCDLIGPVFADGGAGGDSSTLQTVATGLEVFITELSGANAQTTLGGEAYASSHSLEMKHLAATLAITPQYKIRVYSRDGVAERVFERPVSASESFSPTLIFKALLVRQGSV